MHRRERIKNKSAQRKMTDEQRERLNAYRRGRYMSMVGGEKKAQVKVRNQDLSFRRSTKARTATSQGIRRSSKGGREGSRS
jgi:hypothetical protein